MRPPASIPSQIFRGQEFVAELGAFAGYDYKLPVIGSGSKTLSAEINLAKMLPAPYTNGHFTPPMPGTTSGEIPFVFSSVDLLMGYGNWGAAGVLVHPAVKVGLHSDSLRMTLHDNVAGTDQPIVSGTRMRLGVDPARKQSNFWIGDPVYNLGFIVTPGVDAHAFIDVGVWSNHWHFPVWFPDIAIRLPPGGIDFSCHAETICRRDYAFNAGSAVDPTAEVGGIAVDRVAADRPGPDLAIPMRPEISGVTRSPVGEANVVGDRAGTLRTVSPVAISGVGTLRPAPVGWCGGSQRPTTASACRRKRPN